MHELSVTQNLLDIAVRHAEQAGALRITQVNIVVGQLSSIVDDSVQFYWDMISAGTIAHKAQLNFKRIPAQLRCTDCAHEFLMNERDFVCPRCGSGNLVVAGGEEFYLESIDVDMAASSQSPEETHA